MTILGNIPLTVYSRLEEYLIQKNSQNDVCYLSESFGGRT
jgi:hypothetical protein